jgi:hypothetical protein
LVGVPAMLADNSAAITVWLTPVAELPVKSGEPGE